MASQQSSDSHQNAGTGCFNFTMYSSRYNLLLLTLKRKFYGVAYGGIRSLWNLSLNIMGNKKVLAFTLTLTYIPLIP
jgi:hypothetical protein